MERKEVFDLYERMLWHMEYLVTACRDRYDRGLMPSVDFYAGCLHVYAEITQELKNKRSSELTAIDSLKEQEPK